MEVVMHRVLVCLVIGLISICMASNVVAQQDNSYSSARGLFMTKKADGLRVVVYSKDRNNRFIPVDPRTTFKKGDKIRVSVVSNFDGYVYILNTTPNGRDDILFPYPNSNDNEVQAGKEYLIPGNAEFQFDDEKGVETLQVFFSRDRLMEFERSSNNKASRNRYESKYQAEEKPSQEDQDVSTNKLKEGKKRASIIGGIVKAPATVTRATLHALTGWPKQRGIIINSLNESDGNKSADDLPPNSKKSSKNEDSEDSDTENFITINPKENNNTNNRDSRANGRLGKDEYGVFEVKLKHK